jgi:AraC-like DNA-binding protein
MTPYVEFAPPAALARWVECAWSVAPSEPLAGYPVRPDGCLDIVYSPEDGLRAIGAMTATKCYDFPPESSMMGIRFHPGMAGAFLRAAPAELTDLAVSLEDLWGRAARDLEARLQESAALSRAPHLLAGLIGCPERPLSPIHRAMEAITAAHGIVDLDDIASQANLSPRQFRRRCLEESGLAPKHLCRVLRFRHACSLAGRNAHPDWTGIASVAGYFDQAHLIRDFHEFAGATPMTVFSNTPPVPAR